MTVLRVVRRVGAAPSASPVGLDVPAAASTAAAAAPNVTAATEGPGGLPLNGWDLTGDLVIAAAGLSTNPADYDLYDGPDTPSASTVIEGYYIPYPIDIRNGIVVRDCLTREQFKGPQNGETVIERVLSDTGDRGENPSGPENGGPQGTAYYGAIDTNTGAGAPLYVSMFVARGWGRGFWIDGGGEAEYVVHEFGTWHGNAAALGSHNAAMTHRSTHPVVYRYFRFDCYGQRNLSNVAGVQGNQSAAGNCRLEHGLLEADDIGSRIAFRADTHSPGVILSESIDVINCRWPSHAGAYDTAYLIEGSGKGEWADNYRYDPEAPDGKGEAIL